MNSISRNLWSRNAKRACQCRKVDGILGTKVLTTPGSEDSYPERILNGRK
jgi:hypothetical protein